jgi:hypothetical protein
MAENSVGDTVVVEEFLELGEDRHADLSEARARHPPRGASDRHALGHGEDASRLRARLAALDLEFHGQARLQRGEVELVEGVAVEVDLLAPIGYDEAVASMWACDTTSRLVLSRCLVAVRWGLRWSDWSPTCPGLPC